MRPSRLEMTGFASFREPTTVDLDGADLFVLTGPTGAGKSSIIDAMVFALYGSVPRYDDRRLVAPVISQGKREARVRLTFSVEGRRYAATRVVRRTKTGATTKEARLERLPGGGEAEVLAGTADELTEAVEALLGLRFEHFVRTVVLPQGDFQEFLHARPKDRQDLLVELLDLDIYRRVAATARERAATASAAAELHEGRLAGDLAAATPAAVAAARSRIAVIEAVQHAIDEARPRLDELVERGQAARREAGQAAERAGLLDAIAVPDGVGELSAALQAATAAVAAAEAAMTQAIAEREAAEERLAELPDAARLDELHRLRERERSGHARCAELQEELAAARERAEAAQAALDTATRTAIEAGEQVRRAERRHLAHTLVEDLEVGAPCPVCDQPVERVPDTDDQPELDRVRAQAGQAEEDRRAAEATLRQATETLTRAESALGHHTETLEQTREAQRALADELGIGPDADALATARRRVEAAATALAGARRSEKASRDTLGRARDRQAADRDGIEDAWKEFDRTRDALAVLEPPPAPREDLASAWRQLAEFAEEQRPRLVREATAAKRRIEATEQEYREVVEQVRGEATRAEVTAPRRVQELERAVLEAAAGARAEADRLERDLAAAAEARAELERLRRRAALARELGRHLGARNFEQWLLNRALRRLVAGASTVLRDLSSGAYSLSVSDDGAFLVVDHRNADEVRPARTLSGGETFLASLALALALADHVADLAAHGSARLDALFLDEGFGTLDAETLDTVAAAIEELGARGRMVGLVTHVRELAERLPLRYEVRRGAATSTVERVEA